MNIEEFDYSLPEELIAKYPVIPRHNARLMVLNRKTRSIQHDIFWNLPSYLEEGDLLVFNDTKVIPARLYGRKKTGGKVEVLLTDFISPSQWIALVGGKNIKEGLSILVGEDLEILILEHIEKSKFKVELVSPNPFEAILKHGQIPIPPYLKREAQEIDKEYYQTVFAKVHGSAAAPTASLHFSEELIEKLRQKGINITFVTLHVSYGTFKPVEVKNIEEHKVDPEYVSISEETLRLIKQTKEKTKRVVAVGTTVARALETKPFEPFSGYTDLYIYPGFEFKVVDALITNFHLPKSSLLFLVSAFAGKDFVMQAYQEAIQEKYRFYSYGDGMLIL